MEKSSKMLNVEWIRASFVQVYKLCFGSNSTLTLSTDACTYSFFVSSEIPNFDIFWWVRFFLFLNLIDAWLIACLISPQLLKKSWRWQLLWRQRLAGGFGQDLPERISNSQRNKWPLFFSKIRDFDGIQMLSHIVSTFWWAPCWAFAILTSGFLFFPPGFKIGKSQGICSFHCWIDLCTRRTMGLHCAGVHCGRTNVARGGSSVGMPPAPFLGGSLPW